MPRWQKHLCIPGQALRPGAYKQQLRWWEEAELELVSWWVGNVGPTLTFGGTCGGMLPVGGMAGSCSKRKRAPARPEHAESLLQDLFGQGASFSPRPVVGMLGGGRRDFAWGICEWRRPIFCLLSVARP